MSILCAYIVPPMSEADYKPHIENFVESYLKFKPRIEHKLIMVLKDLGYAKCVDFHTKFKDIAWTYDDNEGLDIGSYIRVSRRLGDFYEYFVGLSTYAKLLCPNWLELMHDAIKQENVGLVGATGSYEKGAKGIEFPNYHIRTSCFMIKSILFNDLEFNKILGKDECYEFEHGDNSLTWQIIDKGFRCVVVGKDGRVFDKEEWPNSYTFRHGNQSNLIASDNHTRNFETLSKERQIQMYKEAYFTGDR